MTVQFYRNEISQDNAMVHLKPVNTWKFEFLKI